MLGTYRLILAVCVALSHVGVQVAGLNPGVVAVVGFYLVSGYVMTGLLRTHYRQSGTIGAFYADRALRLLPHYLFVAFVTFAWFVATDQRTEYLQRAPTVTDAARNLLIVPMNYYMFNHADDFALIPPSWSLGAEVQFYVVLPFILLFSRSAVRTVALVLSVAFYLCAAFGVVNSEWFGYRLLPGVLFIFLVGSLLYDAHHSNEVRRRGVLVWGTVAVSGVVAVTLANAGTINMPYNRETLLGLAMGGVALNALGLRARHPIDEALGNLSYGVFLNHFAVQWMLFHGAVTSTGAILVYLATSIAVAALLYRSVERPVLMLRRHLRRNSVSDVLPGVIDAVRR
jgi:peptidoglycan/LPS O-acetylase OafA/YrhL